MDGPWVVYFQNCVRWPRPPYKDGCHEQTVLTYILEPYGIWIVKLRCIRHADILKRAYLSQVSDTGSPEPLVLLAVRTFIIPPSLLNLLFSVCGGVISGSNHGIINSPGYPGNYPNNRDCVWRISVNPGNNIVLAFAALDLERHANCSHDYLKV